MNKTSSGNDTFIVGVNTLVDVNGGAGGQLDAGPNVVGTADVVDGGAGTDTLNWYAAEAVNNSQVGAYSNIENINLFNADFIGTGVTQALLDAVDAAKVADDAADAAAEAARDAANEAEANAIAADAAADEAEADAVIADGLADVAEADAATAQTAANNAQTLANTAADAVITARATSIQAESDAVAAEAAAAIAQAAASAARSDANSAAVAADNATAVATAAQTNATNLGTIATTAETAATTAQTTANTAAAAVVTKQGTAITSEAAAVAAETAAATAFAAWQAAIAADAAAVTAAADETAAVAVNTAVQALDPAVDTIDDMVAAAQLAAVPGGSAADTAVLQAVIAAAGAAGASTYTVQAAAAVAFQNYASAADAADALAVATNAAALSTAFMAAQNDADGARILATNDALALVAAQQAAAVAQGDADAAQVTAVSARAAANAALADLATANAAKASAVASATTLDTAADNLETTAQSVSLVAITERAGAVTAAIAVTAAEQNAVDKQRLADAAQAVADAAQADAVELRGQSDAATADAVALRAEANDAAYAYFTANRAADALELVAVGTQSDLDDAIDAVTADAPAVNVAFFKGATNITSDGEYVNFTNVNGQTITFTADTVHSDITLAKGATQVTVVYDGTTAQGADQDDLDVSSIHAAGNNQGTLSTLNIVSDSIEDLSIYAWEAKTLNLAINSDAVIDVNELGQEKDAGANVVKDLASIKSTGSGDITLNINDGTAIESVTTAGGDDTVNWNLGRVDYDLTITTGAGSDTVKFAGDLENVLTQNAKINIDLGTDNDTFDAADILVTDFAPEITQVDGGAGIDTLKVLMEGFQTEETYIRLTDDFRNFETLVLTQYDQSDAEDAADDGPRFSDGLAPVEIDASKLANFTRFELTGYNDYENEGPVVFTNVLSTQTVSTQFDWRDGSGGGGIELTAQGYGKVGADVADIHAEHITPIGGGDTHTEWEMYGDNATIDINNNSAEDAEQGAEVFLFGDVNTLTINVDGGFTSGDGYADVGLDVGADDFANLTSVTVNGEGASYVWIYNYEGAALANVNASGMDATGLSTDADWSEDFYYYTDNASVAESITLGDSVDTISFGKNEVDGNVQWGTNRAKMDLITGFDFKKDAIQMPGSWVEIEGQWQYVQTSFTLVAEEDLVGSTLSTVLQNLATDTEVDNFVFQYKGNTYLYIDEAQSSTADTLSSNDFLLKIVGTTDIEVNNAWIPLAI